MDGWMHVWMYVNMDGWTDGWMDGQMGGWVDGWMEGWEGLGTGPDTDTQTHLKNKPPSMHPLPHIAPSSPQLTRSPPFACVSRLLFLPDSQRSTPPLTTFIPVASVALQGPPRPLCFEGSPQTLSLSMSPCSLQARAQWDV